MLGYAATTDVRNVPTVVVDQDQSADSRALVRAFAASQSFEIVGSLSTVRDLDSYLDRREAWIALVVPSDYGERVRSGRRAVVQVVADGSDANSTNVALGYAGGLVES